MGRRELAEIGQRSSLAKGMMDHIRGLRFGPVDQDSLHICVDMQLLFANDSPWASQAVAKALPAAREITARKAQSTIFTRFLSPREPKALSGQWQQFYFHCPEIMKLPPSLFEVVPELRAVSEGAVTVDRHVFSVFASNDLQARLKVRSPKALIFTGVEADVCVLASVFSAIDAGFRVIVVEEGVSSSNEIGCRAALEGILPRFDQQVELVSADELLCAWA